MNNILVIMVTLPIQQHQLIRMVLVNQLHLPILLLRHLTRGNVLMTGLIPAGEGRWVNAMVGKTSWNVAARD
jgi:hypothetical protein